MPWALEDSQEDREAGLAAQTIKIEMLVCPRRLVKQLMQGMKHYYFHYEQRANHSPTHVSGRVVSALFIMTTKLYSLVLQELAPLSPLTVPRMCH